MAKDVIHVSEAAAGRDFASLMAHVRAGGEIVIEDGSQPVAIIHRVEPARGRSISESIALAEAHAKELGSEPTLDANFAADLKSIIDSRKARTIQTWD